MLRFVYERNDMLRTIKDKQSRYVKTRFEYYFMSILWRLDWPEYFEVSHDADITETFHR